jgi:hypothetical protein
MNVIRRAALLIGLTVAVIVGSSIPASATFTDSVSRSAPIVTGSVTAPSTINVAKSCTQTQTGGGYYNSWGQWVAPTFSYWYTATVSWPAGAATSGVTGYRVMAHLNTGQSIVMAETDANTRTLTQTVDRSYLQMQPRLSVITLTRTNWTAETARTAVLGC